MPFPGDLRSNSPKSSWGKVPQRPRPCPTLMRLYRSKTGNTHTHTHTRAHTPTPSAESKSKGGPSRTYAHTIKGYTSMDMPPQTIGLRQQANSPLCFMEGQTSSKAAVSHVLQLPFRPLSDLLPGSCHRWAESAGTTQCRGLFLPRLQCWLAGAACSRTSTRLPRPRM
jgi:hypothetical protein